uniref:zinc finger protein 79-like isoform X1 n=1 Tax=Myxine glutinosa TaxID=7769 RepID=UPI00358E6F8A
MNCPEVTNTELCPMNRDLSGEKHKVNPPGSTRISDGRNLLGPGESPGDKEFGPDSLMDEFEEKFGIVSSSSFGFYKTTPSFIVNFATEDFIVAVKVESDFLDQSSPLDKGLIMKVKVKSEFEDDSISQEKGEAQVVKSKTFQNNLLQTSQYALSNDHVKQEPCDSRPTEPSKAAQLLEEKQVKQVSCTNCSQLFDMEVFNQHMTQSVCQETDKYSSLSCTRICKCCAETPKDIQGSEGPRKCYVCDKSFTVLSSLKVHQKMHTREKLHKCSVCSKGFIRHSKLKIHQRVHTGEKPYTCPVCNKTFGHSSSLDGHQRIHTGARPYKCSVCRKGFSSSSYMSQHQKIHTGEKPFKCSLCPKAFAQSSNLNNHQRIHTGEKPHKCSVCSKVYAYISELKIHQRKHTGEKPFTCSLCPKAFAQSSNLYNHQRMHTGEELHKCSLCPKTFAHLSHLQQHQKSSHRRTRFKTTDDNEEEQQSKDEHRLLEKEFANKIEMKRITTQGKTKTPSNRKQQRKTPVRRTNRALRKMTPKSSPLERNQHFVVCSGTAHSRKRTRQTIPQEK